jgi:ABC-2 type transport system permease protein
MGIKSELSHTFWITWKDLMELRRSKMRMAMMVLMPLIMMAMMSFMFPSTNSVSNIPVMMVNADPGAMGSGIVQALEQINSASGMMVLKNASSEEEARDMIVEGNALGAIVIPENFSQILTTRSSTVNITVITDNSNPQISQMLSQVLTQIIDSMGERYAVMGLEPIARNIGVNPVAMVVPFRAEAKGVTEGGSYVEFVIPGLLMMTMISSVMTGLPRAIAYEKDIGTMNGFLAAPISRFSIIGGKALGRIIRGFIQGILSLILAIVLFRINVYGNLLAIFAILFLGVFSFVGLGIVLTSVAEDEETASMIIMTLTLPMMFLSGIFFPIQMMPSFMQTISKWLPFTYAVDAMRRIMVFGATLGNVYNDVLVMLIFGIATLIIAIPVFERGMTR